MTEDDEQLRRDTDRLVDFMVENKISKKRGYHAALALAAVVHRTEYCDHLGCFVGQAVEAFNEVDDWIEQRSGATH